LYSKGITRICATDNPGKTTEPGRWKDVGYCDDQKVRCWIDTKDVADNIVAKNLENQTITAIDSMNKDNSLVTGTADTQDLTKQKTDDLNTNASKMFSDMINNIPENTPLYWINEFDSRLALIESEFDSAYDRAIFSQDKVKLLFLKANVFDNATRILKTKFFTTKDNSNTATTPAVSNTATQTVADTFTLEKVANLDAYNVNLNNVYYNIYFGDKSTSKYNLYFDSDTVQRYLLIGTVTNNKIAIQTSSNNFKMLSITEQDKASRLNGAIVDFPSMKINLAQ